MRCYKCKARVITKSTKAICKCYICGYKWQEKTSLDYLREISGEEDKLRQKPWDNLYFFVWTTNKTKNMKINQNV